MIKTIEFAVAPGQQIGITLKGEYPCQIECVSGSASTAGLQNGDLLMAIANENVQNWQHDRVAALLFSQNDQLVKLTVRKSNITNKQLQLDDDAENLSPLATLSDYLQISAKTQLPVDQNIRFIRSFDVPISVVTCENALLSLRQKLVCWARRPLRRRPSSSSASVDHYIRISCDTRYMEIMPANIDSTANPVASVLLKDIILFGTLQSVQNVWALLTRGTRRRLGINLFYLLPQTPSTSSSPQLKQHQQFTTEPREQDNDNQLKENMNPIGYCSRIKDISETLNSLDRRSSVSGSPDRSSINSVSYGKESKCHLVPFNSLNSLNEDQNFIDQAVNHWHRSLSNLLNDPFGKHAFKKFLQSEFSIENLSFWNACSDYSKISDENERAQQAKIIWNKFLDVNSVCSINIGSKLKQKCFNSLNNPTPDLFEPIQEQIYSLMKYDSYPRFLRSEYYRDCQSLTGMFNCESRDINDSDANTPPVQSDMKPGEKSSKAFPMFQWARAVIKWKKNTQEKRTSTLTDNSVSQLSKTCIIILPAHIAITVNLQITSLEDENAKQKILNVLNPVLKKLGFIWYRTYLEDTISGQRIEYEEPVSQIASSRLFLKTLCLLAFKMPDKEILIIRSNPSKTFGDLLALFQSYGYSFKLDKIHLAVIDTDIKIISIDDTVKPFDNKCIAIRTKRIKITVPRIRIDYFDAIPDDELMVRFDNNGVLTSKRNNRNISSNVEILKSSEIPGNELLDSTDDDSPPAVFRRRPQQIHNNSMLYLQSNDQQTPITSNNDVLPVQFIFSIDSISAQNSPSSLSSIDSLAELSLSENPHSTTYNINDINDKPKQQSSELENNQHLSKPRSRQPVVGLSHYDEGHSLSN
ncbi:hypothetical protein GJ496_005367 [Pomphorhynchus laevis]|nr:hypothetical protein GJ496_005367 [Pomphorhynchus laevis]